MTLTPSDSEIYQQQANHDSSEQISIWKLPKIMWIAVGVFSVNLLVGTGIFVTTSDTPSNISSQHAVSVVLGKPSPFTETVDTTRHKVRMATKLHPVSFVSVPADGPAATDSASPLTPQPVAYSDRGYEIHRAIDITSRAAPNTEAKFIVN